MLAGHTATAEQQLQRDCAPFAVLWPANVGRASCHHELIQEGIEMITSPGDSSSSSMTILFNGKDDLESPSLVEGPFNQHQFPYHLSADAGAGKAPFLSRILNALMTDVMASPPCNKEPPQWRQQPSHITRSISPVWLQMSCCRLQEQQPTEEAIMNDDPNNHWKLLCLQNQLSEFRSPNGMLYIKGLMMKAEADLRSTASHIRDRHWYPGHKFWTLHLPSDCILLHLEKKLTFAEAAIAAMEIESHDEGNAESENKA
jgi:hypothetical protein